MKVLAFAASNSRQSINKQLVIHATQLLKAQYEVEVELLDVNDYEMPLYSTDRENASGLPQAAKDFYAKIGEADALIISFAEHNGTYTAAFKNLFDWASRVDMKVYQETPTLMLATSPGQGGASSVLSQATASAPYFAGNVKADLSIPSFYDNFDSNTGELINLELKDKLQSALAQLFADA